MYRIKPSRDEHTFEGFIAYNSLKLQRKSRCQTYKKCPIRASVSETCLPAKGVPEGCDIFITHSRHVETVVLLSRKLPDDKIEIDLNLDELDVTASESKATYDEIKSYVQDKADMKVTNL